MSPFGRLFGLSGRANRREWWLVVVLANVTTFLLAEGLVAWAQGGPEISAALRLVMSLPALWLIVAVSVRRRHDVGKPGGLVAGLILLRSGLGAAVVGLSAMGADTQVIAVAGAAGLAAVLVMTIYLFVVLGFPPGTPGANAYGAGSPPPAA